jgi:hypothetical protein
MTETQQPRRPMLESANLPALVPCLPLFYQAVVYKSDKAVQVEAIQDTEHQFRTVRIVQIIDQGFSSTHKPKLWTISD